VDEVEKIDREEKALAQNTKIIEEEYKELTGGNWMSDDDLSFGAENDKKTLPTHNPVHQKKQKAQAHNSKRRALEHEQENKKTCGGTSKNRAYITR